MTDVDPEIWDNKTLGSANGLPYLDEVSSQVVEDQNARREGREPRKVEERVRFSDGSTNLTKYVVDDKVIDPANPSEGIAYFNPDELAPVAHNVPPQKNGVDKGRAPTATSTKKDTASK